MLDTVHYSKLTSRPAIRCDSRCQKISNVAAAFNFRFLAASKQHVTFAVHCRDGGMRSAECRLVSNVLVSTFTWSGLPTVDSYSPCQLSVPVVCKQRLPTVNVAGVDDEGISLLQRQLREKDLRLTDVRLEALTSAHRLHQMQDAVKRLKASIATSVLITTLMSSLKFTRWRTQRAVQHKEVVNNQKCVAL